MNFFHVKTVSQGLLARVLHQHPAYGIAAVAITGGFQG